MFTDKLRFPCPTATMLCLVYPDQEAASARAGFKFMRTTSLSQTKSARFLPKLAEQSAEWRHVQAELQAGKKLVKLFYGLTSISPLGQGDAHERIIKAIYKAAGWDLADERFLQLQGLVAAFPLCLADGLADDMARLKRLKTMLSTTAAHIAPMQGEYLGGVIPHLLLVGRRGQPFWWSPFENGAGNHNIAICGKSGSGKSVLLQELCAALRGAGAKVVVIDDGRSFEHSVKLQGGRFVEFTLASGFSLNPFSMVDDARAHEDEDYRLDCFAMIKAIIGQMARPAENGIRKAAMQRDGLDQHIAAPVGQILLIVLCSVVLEVDRLDRDTEDQPAFFRRPRHIDLLGADTTSHPTFCARASQLSGRCGTGLAHAPLSQFFCHGEGDVGGNLLAVGFLLVRLRRVGGLVASLDQCRLKKIVYPRHFSPSRGDAETTRRALHEGPLDHPSPLLPIVWHLQTARLLLRHHAEDASRVVA